MEEIKVTAERITEWSRAKKMALQTTGKKMVNLPDEEWKRMIVLCEHSPLRVVEYDVHIENIPYCTAMHLVRHFIGVIPFVSTQRDDRVKNDIPRGEKPQNAPVSVSFAINAQALINISKVRLCGSASAETRHVWRLVKEAIAGIDPIVAHAMVPACIYRSMCPEPTCCGFFESPKYMEESMEYFIHLRKPKKDENGK